MNESPERKLVVVDPGLITAGGHHAGFAAFVADAASTRGYQIEFVCHRDLSSELRPLLEKEGCTTNPQFTFDFYRFFGRAAHLPEIFEHIQTVSQEIGAAISGCSSDRFSRITYFYPSINWDHAQALAIALQTEQSNTNSVHKCCAMFNPGMDHRGNSLDENLIESFSTAFASLSHCRQARIYASDAELAWKYQKILGQNTPLPLHPSYLDDWEAPISTLKRLNGSHRTINITLYLGDAKENKGFCRLPEIAEKLLSEKGSNISVYVQYTYNRGNTKIQAAAAQLASMASEDPRLRVDARYLPAALLRERLATTDAFVFTYDEKTYKEKSSGILQLVAWYCPVAILFGSTWLNREADRLGLYALNMQSEEVSPATIRDACSRANLSSPDARTIEYRRQIYAPFWPWLEN